MLVDRSGLKFKNPLIYNHPEGLRRKIPLEKVKIWSERQLCGGKCFVDEERQQEATVLGYMVSAKWI